MEKNERFLAADLSQEHSVRKLAVSKAFSAVDAGVCDELA